MQTQWHGPGPDVVLECSRLLGTESAIKGVDESDFAKNTLAERSKAVAQGAIPKGRGSDPTGVILFGLILRHDVLHTWSGPYIQRAPAILGPCRCFTNCCLAEPTPGIPYLGRNNGKPVSKNSSVRLVA
jgi:hypothetical protein